MTEKYPFDPTYTVLTKSMDVASRRHAVISSNLANLDTVGYRPRSMDFQKTLNAVIAKSNRLYNTDEKHFKYGAKPPLAGEFVETADEVNPDPVNIDTEMSNLVDNNLRFKTSVEMLMRKMQLLKHAITEGGR